MIFQLGYSKNEKTRSISEKMSGLKAMLKNIKKTKILFFHLPSAGIIQIRFKGFRTKFHLSLWLP
jgi:hypothetical protein